MALPVLSARTVLALWSAAVLTSPAIAQDLTLAPREQFGQVVVTAKQMATGGPQFEQAFGGVFDSEPAYRLNANSTVRQLARAVGRLDILFSRGTGYCTAFLISDSQLMTNAHCLSAGHRKAFPSPPATWNSASPTAPKPTWSIPSRWK